MAKKQTDIQKRINKTAGQRQNMNGAGAGGRFVASRNGSKAPSQTVNRGKAKVQLGSRRQRWQDLRAAMGLSTG